MNRLTTNAQSLRQTLQGSGSSALVEVRKSAPKRIPQKIMMPIIQEAGGEREIRSHVR